jgi:AmmeMemoRadiSam system protein B
MVHGAIDVRPSPLAGKWYPANATALTAMLDQFLGKAELRLPDNRIAGLLAPHAGMRYSGPVAAHAFAQVRERQVDTVVIVGPLHHPISGAVLTSAHTHYETPLGLVPVDRAALEAIGRLVPLTTLRSDPEHSVEIELPFLQHLLKPGFSLVPLMLHDQSEARAEALGAALAETLKDRRTLIVASSDLSHFYPQDIAHQLDKTMLDCVATMDAPGVIELNERGRAFACGHGAIATTLHAIRAWGTPTAHIVGYGTSGDITGDLSSVVGYGAATFGAGAV